MRDNLQFLNVFEAVRATVSLQHLLGAQQEFTQVTFRPANVVDPWPNKGVFVYIYIPVVPHKAVAEVSKIGNL